MYGPFEPFCDPMALSIMVKFTKPGRLIAQTSYLGRFKPLKKFGKSFLKSVKVYRRILDLAQCAVEVFSGRQTTQLLVSNFS